MFVTICWKVTIINKPPVSRDRLVVRTLRCGRSNPGSNPGHGINILTFQQLLVRNKKKWLFYQISSVSGIMVSIAAFQAVDPGSIPG